MIYNVIFLLVASIGHHVHSLPSLFSIHPVVQQDGFLANTHDVEAARHSHLAAVATLGHHQHHSSEHTVLQDYHDYDHKPYYGPTAIPLVLPSGHLADTPEVAVAKIHHLSAVSQARAAQYYSGHGDSNYGGAFGYTSSHNGYAVPVVLPNGHIADTKEVAAAKSAHLTAVAKAKAENYYSGHSEGYGYADGHSYSHHGHGVPVVLPSGHLADTHEVAAAKSAHMAAVAHAKAQQVHSHVGEEYEHEGGHYVPYLEEDATTHHQDHYEAEPEVIHLPVYLLHQGPGYSPRAEESHGGFGHLHESQFLTHH